MSVGGNQPIVFKEKDINLANTEICCYNITLRQHLWCQVIFLKKHNKIELTDGENRKNGML